MGIKQDKVILNGIRRLISTSIILLLLLVILEAAAADQAAAGRTRIGPALIMQKKAHFVLVHGFGTGAWSWYKVRSLLEASGHKVTSLDLKSAGIDPISVDSVHSFKDYNQPLLDFLHRLNSSSHHHVGSGHGHENCNEKVIVVGHSAGGLTATYATYLFAGKIQVAVYLAATMLKHGFATHQDIIEGVPEAYRSPPLPPRKQGQSARGDFCHMISPEDVVLFEMLNRPGPLEVILKDAIFSGRRLGVESNEVDKVPRVYIKTKYDRTLKPNQQEAMIKRWPPSSVLSLDADHNPLFCAPIQLVGLLSQIATVYSSDYAE